MMLKSNNNNTYLDDNPALSTALLSEISDGIIVADASGEIKWINRAYENLTGYSLDELLHKNARIEEFEQLNTDYSNILWHSILDGKDWKGECWNNKKNKENYLEERSITSLKDKNNEITHFVAVIRDITYQNQVAKQLDSAKRIEAIGNLTAGIAHNFNNKLASILGFSDLLQGELKQFKNDDIDDSINEIITAGKLARDLVKQLMAFSVTTKSDVTPVDLQLAIIQAVKTITATLPAEINIHTVFDDVPLVELDLIRLHQMLISLAVNACTAMEKHGQLSFKLEKVTLDNIHCSSCYENISGDFACISVKDTGKGIPEKDISNIFLPFFSTQQHEGGTGMGLSALHGMLHDMKGHIVVDSVINEYTDVKILFPLENIINEESIDYADSAVNESKSNVIEHILVVDDEVSVANFMFELLMLNNYKVTKQTDSNQAYKLFLDNPNKYDLLITDQSMPEISGTELADRIHSIRQDLPIIIMTGYSEDNFSSQSDVSYTLLTKPFDTLELLEIIKNI